MAISSSNKEKPKYEWRISFDLNHVKLEDKKELIGDNIKLKQIGEKQVHGELYFKTEFDDERVYSIVLEKLNDFLNMTALYHFNIDIDETLVLEKFEYKINNSMELYKAGIKTPSVFTIATHADVILSQEYLDDLEGTISKLKSSKYYADISNILNQYRIAYMQDNPYVRYEQLWLSFMVLINSLKSVDKWPDKTSISDFVKGSTSTLEKKHVDTILEILNRGGSKFNIIIAQDMKCEKYKNLIDFLIGLNLPPWNGDSYSKELKDVIDEESKTGKNDNRYKLLKIFLCLYGIRNQLFHRTDYVFKELNIGRMRLACFALATIMRISINSYVVKFSDLK